MKPTGVRLHRADGTVINCELVLEGLDAEGDECWRIANVLYRPGDKITVEVMPGHTSIGFTAPHHPAGVDLEWSEESGERKQASVEVDYEKQWKRDDE